MAATQLSRVLWQSSRCARLELHRSITASTSLLQRRANHTTATTASVLSSGGHDSEASTPPNIDGDSAEASTSVSTTEISTTLEGEPIKPKRVRRTKAELARAALEEPIKPKNIIPTKKKAPGEKRTRGSGKKKKPEEVKKKLLPRAKKHGMVEVVEMDVDNPTGIPFLNLPPMNTWKEAFSNVREGSKRPTIRNPETARMLADKMIPEGSKDKTVIEAFSGPGQLSRALLQLPRERIKKLIIIESVFNYWKYVKPLEQIDDRVTVVQMSGRDWSTYSAIEKLGLLKDVETVDWEQVHPHLHFIMQMGGGVDGELVGAQLLRTIPDRQWLFKFGRMPMNFVISDRMWERFRAPEAITKEGQARCKVSVMAQSVTNSSETVPYDALQPYGDHFHPERHNQYEEKHSQLEKRRAGNPHVAIGFVPKLEPLIKPGDLDYWDYVVRKLFVVKATPLQKSISALGPGAYNILKKFTNPEDPKNRVDISKSPRSLTVDEWNLVVQAFRDWPFRPMDLGIEQMFAKSTS